MHANKLAKLYRILLAFLIVFVLCAGAPAVSAQGPSLAFRPGPELVMLADPAYSNLRVPAPAAAALPRRNAASSITVTFIPAGSPDPGDSSNPACAAFPPEAQAAYLYAVNIWDSYTNSPEPIRIAACWRLLPDGALGSAGPLLVTGSGLPKSNRWYPLALADFLTNSDNLPTNYAITSRFTSDIGIDPKTGTPYGPWYFGTDGNNPGGSYDFASVVLHEIGHGLGFTGTMRVNAQGLGSYGLGSSGYPMVYDDFTQNAGGTPLLSLPNNSSQLAAALTSAAYFSGPLANAANGGQRISLYSPSTWAQGSSYSHLADSFDGTPNALMTFSLQNGEVIHDPGPVALGILGDIGWVIPAGTSTPAAPSGLSAFAASTSQVNLSWLDNSANETGFQIERSLDGASWTRIYTAAANATSYQDSSLSSGTKYFYHIRAVSGTFTSPYSDAVSATSLGPPPPPGALAAKAAGDTQINLTWQDTSNIESGYFIERSDDSGASFNSLATTAAGATSYSDQSLAAGKSYQYRVSTVSPQGDSSPAGPVTAATWAVAYHIFASLITH